MHHVHMTRAKTGSESGGALEVVLASVAVAVALAALAVALTRDSGRNGSTAVTTTTMSARELCAANRASFDKRLRALEDQEHRLQKLVPVFGAQLAAERSTNSHDVGATDAAHQADLREQSDIQQRILRLVKHRPPTCS
jgi:hypothetical protein